MREHLGSKYRSDRDIATTARLVRQDIKDAIKAGELSTIKVGVTIQRYAGGSTLHLSIKEAPMSCFNTTYWAPGDASAERPQRYTVEGQANLDKLSQIAGAYQRMESDMQTDYCSTNFFINTSYHWGLEEKARDLAEMAAR